MSTRDKEAGVFLWCLCALLQELADGFMQGFMEVFEPHDLLAEEPEVGLGSLSQVKDRRHH